MSAVEFRGGDANPLSNKPSGSAAKSARNEDSQRIHRKLLGREVECSENTVAIAMKEAGVPARTKRSFLLGR